MSVPRPGWDLRRVEHVLREERRSVEPSEAFDGDVFHYSIPVVQSSGDGAIESAADIKSGKLRIRGPSVLVSKLNPRKAVVVHANERGRPTICSSEFICLRPKSADLRYAYYLFLSEDVRQSLEALVKSATRSHQRVVPSDLTKLQLAWPSLPIQRAIASFLDRETAKIDILIEKKQRLLELLEEKRTALITRAVTKGLDPDVPMKDSGVEWLGEIPAHWDVASVRSVFAFLDHKRIPLSAEERGRMTEREYPYYGASGVIDHVEDYLFDEPLLLVAEDGANLLSRSTPLAFVASGEYWVNNHAHVLKPRIGDLNFWAYVLRTVDFTPWVEGAAQPKLTQGNLASIRLPVPPIEESDRIVVELSSAEESIDTLASRAAHATKLLREYRSALISAAVTGKLDIPAEDSAA